LVAAGQSFDFGTQLDQEIQNVEEKKWNHIMWSISEYKRSTEALIADYQKIVAELSPHIEQANLSEDFHEFVQNQKKKIVSLPEPLEEYEGLSAVISQEQRLP
jgi:hypothetical protein